jgi:plastocyanin
MTLTGNARALCCLLVLLLSLAHAQDPAAPATGELSLQFLLDGKHPGRNASGIVVWLEPESAPLPAPVPGNFVLVQKNKQFRPHLLVVPVGSSVDFPNEDPFFHNVFSLFNGRRFDLGLYESHTHRAVRFDREGISYIFCNIHPEMGAVIVSLRTPYYGVSAADGTVTLSGLPPGSYRLKLWAEDVPAKQLDATSRLLTIPAHAMRLKPIHLEADGDMIAHHLNKFGTDYPPPPQSTY